MLSNTPLNLSELPVYKKYKHIASLKKLTNKLYKNSYRLERANSNGKDFLPILRSELKKFKQLQRSWLLTL